MLVGAPGFAPRREEVELGGGSSVLSRGGTPSTVLRNGVRGHRRMKEEFGQKCQGRDSNVAVREAFLGEEALDWCSLGKQMGVSPSHSPVEAQKACDSGKVTGPLASAAGHGDSPSQPYREAWTPSPRAPLPLPHCRDAVD